METHDEVPIVDLTAFITQGSEAARRQTAKDLREKIQINGFVGFTGHGIPPSRLDQAFDVSRAFFNLDYNDKMKAPHPDGPVPHRGYSGLGKEQVAATLATHVDDSRNKQEYGEVKDYKESFELGSDHNVLQSNIWPPEEVLPGFRQFTTSFFWELNGLASAILEAIALSLDLSHDETNTLLELHRGHDNQLRLLHYPSMESKVSRTESNARLGAHRDWSTFTLLFQDTSGGLQVYDSTSDGFISANPKEGVVYMNVGDMLHRYSNGRYPSALHRVIVLNNRDAGRTTQRYSIPYFVVPLGDGIIAPPRSIVATATNKIFEPVTFNSYSANLFKAMKV